MHTNPAHKLFVCAALEEATQESRRERKGKQARI